MKNKLFTRGRHIGKNIVFAPQDNVSSKEMAPFISRILDAVGHREAFVSDESSIYDFLDVFDSKAKKEKTCKRISKKLGVEVGMLDYFTEVAARMMGKK